MGESKQVKVDNWGIFFLQRLQHFFNKTYFCDLTLQFEDNAQLKVHRLVMNACTEYFQMLEQTCEIMNDCLVMPPDLQADVVVPIVNFMYTGILEFQETIFDRLYTTARLMNMTVLTKLLDAQKVPISPIPRQTIKRSAVLPITWNLQGKRIAPKTMDPDFPEPLPGRKLPIWKRKSVPGTVTYRASEKSLTPDPSTKYFKSNVDDTPKPTRFEWPDEDDNSFDTSSFDEISYTSKPLIMPSREKSPKPSTSNFEELKRSSTSVKRPSSPIYNDNKKMNIQDVKEYLKEQKLRSDYIDYDDSEAADNDLQTYDDDDSAEETADKDAAFDQNADDAPNKSILKNDASTPHNKRVRFSLEGKENAAVKAVAKPGITTPVKPGQSTVNMSNHTKIITEVLKKYPHLVKKNKNIRLKILAKGSNPTSGGLKPAGTPVKIVKPTSKVSYMVMKPDQNAGQATDKKDGHWSCHKCSNPNPLQFDTYYLYRKHLTDVHNEKTDSQMCNICGHVSRKQNMLMYHKYVKHNITPPAMYQFPKCKECPYIALSPTLLTKHQFNHTHVNLVCAECGTSFQNKSQLILHVQLTGHTERANTQTYDCGYCNKKFISDDTLFQHIKKNHKSEARRDNIISSEEIDEMDDQELTTPQASPISEKPKEKIKILSDIKVNSPISTSGLVRSITSISPEKPIKVEETIIEDAQPLVPSSEAESLSNVASGIAASLGLVNTIVVLDENQFILQSQEGVQENISETGQTEFLIPEVTNIENMPNMHVSQHQVLSADNSTIISQATLNKNNITSTDELVMVLTDHDYSDASNNVITSESSNIVVLYSHPVQSQDGQFISQQSNLMLNSDISLMEVGSNYTVANTLTEVKPCEESIEMIQQEINNHLEGEIQQEQDKVLEDQMITFTEVKSDIVQIPVDNIVELPKERDLHEEEKMEIDPAQVHLESTELEFTKENQIQQDSESVYHNTNSVLTENTEITEILTGSRELLKDNTEVSIENTEMSIESTELLTDTRKLFIDDTEMVTGNPELATDNKDLVTDNPEVSVENTELIRENTELLRDSPEVPNENTRMLTENTELSTETTGVLSENTELLTTNSKILTVNSTMQKTVEEIPTNTELIPETTENLTEQTEPIVDTAGVLTHNPEISNCTEMPLDSEMNQENSDNLEDSTHDRNLSPENNENPFEERMEIEESIELIQNEINKSSPELSDVPPDTVVNINRVENSNLKTHKQENTEPSEQDATNENNTESAQFEVSIALTEEVINNEDGVNDKVNINESLPYDEPMEVDSAKLLANNDNLLLQHVKEIVPDSEEEKCATEDELPRDEVDNQQLQEKNNQKVEMNNQEEEKVVNSHQNQETITDTETNSVDQNQETITDTETSSVKIQNQNLENLMENIQEIKDEKSERQEQEEKVQYNEMEETIKKDDENVSTTETKQVDDVINKYVQESNPPIIEPAEKSASKSNKSNNTELLSQLTNSKISILLDDWDDGDTDSQQSETLKPAPADNSNSINTLINDWEDEEDT